jgi:hypothetical protein
MHVPFERSLFTRKNFQYLYLGTKVLQNLIYLGINFELFNTLYFQMEGVEVKKSSKQTFKSKVEGVSCIHIRSSEKIERCVR